MGGNVACLTLRKVDVLAAVYAIVIVVYAVIPQDSLGGEATPREASCSRCATTF